MKGGAYACVKLNVSANTPSPVLPQSCVQKGEGGGGGGIFLGAYRLFK